jgi:hypothetical protein
MWQARPPTSRSGHLWAWPARGKNAKRQAETKQQCNEHQNHGGMIKQRHGKMNLVLDATEKITTIKVW